MSESFQNVKFLTQTQESDFTENHQTSEDKNQQPKSFPLDQQLSSQQKGNQMEAINVEESGTSQEQQDRLEMKQPSKRGILMKKIKKPDKQNKLERKSSEQSEEQKQPTKLRLLQRQIDAQSKEIAQLKIELQKKDMLLKQFQIDEKMEEQYHSFFKYNVLVQEKLKNLLEQKPAAQQFECQMVVDNILVSQTPYNQARETITKQFMKQYLNTVVSTQVKVLMWACERDIQDRLKFPGFDKIMHKMSLNQQQMQVLDKEVKQMKAVKQQINQTVGDILAKKAQLEQLVDKMLEFFIQIREILNYETVAHMINFWLNNSKNPALQLSNLLDTMHDCKEYDLC